VVGAQALFFLFFLFLGPRSVVVRGACTAAGEGGGWWAGVRRSVAASPVVAWCAWRLLRLVRGWLIGRRPATRACLAPPPPNVPSGSAWRRAA